MLTLLDLDDDTLLAVMQALPCRLVRGPLLLVCRRLLALASSSAALGCHVDVAFLGGAKSKAITPILEALSHSDPSPSPSTSTSASQHHNPTIDFPSRPSSIQALAKLNRDGGITSVAVGNHSWGTTTTKKLVKLFPALEAIELVSACSLAVRFTGPYTQVLSRVPSCAHTGLLLLPPPPGVHRAAPRRWRTRTA